MSSSSVAQRSTGQVEEQVFERRPADAQVARLDAERLGQGQDAADRGRHVLGVQDGLAVVVLDRLDAGQGLELVVGQRRRSRSKRTERSLKRRLTSSLTVPIARISPWSMIASRSHRTSASSM